MLRPKSLLKKCKQYRNNNTSLQTLAEAYEEDCANGQKFGAIIHV
jgi:hypothetical protein